MKLELKHITPYLPYSVKAKATNGIDYNGEENFSYFDLNPTSLKFYGTNDITLFLKPLSDLFIDNDEHLKDFRYLDGDGYDDIILKDCITTGYDRFKLGDIYYLPIEMPYDFIDYLMSLHYDVFLLIPEGLAININEL